MAIKQISTNKVDDQDLVDIYLKFSNDRWTNRRRMAYISLFSLIAITFVLMSTLVPIATIDAIQGIIMTICTLLGGFVAGYFTLATWDDIKNYPRTTVSKDVPSAAATVTQTTTTTSDIPTEEAKIKDMGATV